jgi:general nucleoside transport system permease protein
MSSSETTTKNKRFAGAASLFAPAGLAFIMALLIASAVLLITGKNPITAFTAMGKNIAGVDPIVSIINFSARFYVAALALAIGFRMNLFNIGAAGQISIAGMAAGVVGGALHLPPPLHIALATGAAILAGCLWALIPGILKVTRGVNEVVATIMLNYIGGALTSYLLISKWTNFGDPEEINDIATRNVPASGRIPTLNRWLTAVGVNVPKGTRLHGFLIVAILVGIAFYVVLFKTRFGFELRASGMNPAAAKSSGVNPKRMVILTMLFSGMLAGISGAGVVLGDLGVFGGTFPAELGFTAIGIALLGRNHPVGIAFAALVWSTLGQGSRGLASVDIPEAIGQIMLGTLLICAVIVYAVTERQRIAKQISDAANRLQRADPPGTTGPTSTTGNAEVAS